MTARTVGSSTFRFALLGVFLAAACASPLRRAIEEGDPVRVAALLDQGADRKETFSDGVTPLKIAVRARRPDIVELLLARGADVNERRGGAGALTVAVNDGDLSMVKLLLSQGAMPTKVDSFWTPGPDGPAIAALLKDAAEGASRADAPRPAAAPSRSIDHGSDFALVVGIEKYQDAPEARFAENDAEAVSRRLIALGWPSRNVLTLTGERAGRAGLERYLERWLPANVGANARFVFYFAGDGAVDPRTGLAYLLPWDGDAGMLEQTGYPLSRLYQKLDALGARGVAVVIDAGFSGAGERAVQRRESAKVPPADGSGRCAVVLAASGNEAVGVLDDRGHGSLTDALLAGLDVSSSSLTLRGLFESARIAVSERATRQGRRQIPQLLTAAPEDAGISLR